MTVTPRPDITASRGRGLYALAAPSLPWWGGTGSRRDCRPGRTVLSAPHPHRVLVLSDAHCVMRLAKFISKLAASYWHFSTFKQRILFSWVSVSQKTRTNWVSIVWTQSVSGWLRALLFCFCFWLLVLVILDASPTLCIGYGSSEVLMQVLILGYDLRQIDE